MPSDTPNPTRRIIRAVESYYGLNPGDLKRRYRDRRYAWPRQMAMYALRVETGRSYPAIARALGRKDHTTIIYGCKAFSKRAASEPRYVHDLACVLEMCGEGVS